MNNLHVSGFLTRDPELRYTPNGAAVATFVVADQRNVRNENNEWVPDGETTFWHCEVWNALAEKVVESFTKGSGVLLEGSVKTKKYTTKEGEERSVLNLTVFDCGLSLKLSRGKGGSSSGGTQNRVNQSNSGHQNRNVNQSSGDSGWNNDPWSSGGGSNSGARANNSGGGWGAPSGGDEPPF